MNISDGPFGRVIPRRIGRDPSTATFATRHFPNAIRPLDGLSPPGRHGYASRSEPSPPPLRALASAQRCHGLHEERNEIAAFLLLPSPPNGARNADPRRGGATRKNGRLLGTHGASSRSPTTISMTISGVSVRGPLFPRSITTRSRRKWSLRTNPSLIAKVNQRRQISGSSGAL
jgi:hypothetical protein